jgi:transposase
MPTIGIDVHKTESQVAVVADDDGELLDEVRVQNANLGEFAAEYAGASAVIEATSNYYAIYDALDEHLEVSVAHPTDLKWIVESSQKTDRADATKLAELLRLNGVPESYVPPEEIRECRALARGRKKLVEKRSDCKNEVHALLDQNGIQFEPSVFSAEGRERLAALDLEGTDQILLDQWLDMIEAFDERIAALDRAIERVSREIPEVDLLLTIPGVSTFSGVLIHGEIGEVDRFDNAKQLVSYAGLDPTVRESGDSRTEGSISKEGSEYLRWILYNCASTAVHNCKDPYLTEFYERKRRQGKPHKVAMVATARKLLVAIFHMLDREEVYDPPEVSD